MNETSVIRPWQPAQASASTAHPQSAAATETDERLMMARLFGGKGALPPLKAQVAPRADAGEFAPHLGRHVDVIA